MHQERSPACPPCGTRSTQHYFEDIGFVDSSLHSIQGMIAEVASLLGQHKDILDCGGSIARSFGKTLHVDKMSQHPLMSLMGSQGATVISSPGSEQFLDWARVAQGYSFKENIQPQPDGTVHCYIPDAKLTARLSVDEHDIMVSGAPEKLLNPWSYPQDISAELEAITCLKAEMEEVNKQVTEGKLT